MIGEEDGRDAPTISTLLEAAFPSPAEARLVERLRARDELALSLVAREQGNLVGHLAMSPISLHPAVNAFTGWGLAPLAVAPDQQGRGIGGRLIRHALEACPTRGIDLVVVLGDPGYYTRFGFEPAGPLGLDNEYGAADAFMAKVFAPHKLSSYEGLVRYSPAFAELA